MTPRERVLTALQYRQPDRVPVDFSGHRSSGIAAMAYARLRRHLGLSVRPIRVYDPIQQIAIVDDDVLDRFEVDTTELGRAFALEDKDWSEWVLPDGTPAWMPEWVKPRRDEPRKRWVITSESGKVIAQMPDGALYFEQTYYPFHDETPDHSRIGEALSECMWGAVASPPGPLTSGTDGDRILLEGAKRLRASTDRAIIGLFGGNLLEIGQFLYRNDGFLMLLAADPEGAFDFLERLTVHHLKNLEHFLGIVGPYIDVVLFGDDLGMQTGPQISPAMYRELFKPHHAAMWKRAKQLANVKVMLHCCGGVRELLPDLIDAGLDAINPVQISCRGMDAAGLKKDFRGRITFWGGGCDTQEVLSGGTPEEVRRHVHDQVRIMQPGGGFVFQQVHNIMANVPPQNVVAMFDAVREAD
jgi:uroporphyrinogen decarboxylase